MDQITPGVTYGLTALTLAVYSIPLFGVRPWKRTGLRGRFDRLPGVVILELRWAEVAER